MIDLRLIYAVYFAWSMYGVFRVTSQAAFCPGNISVEPRVFTE